MSALYLVGSHASTAMSPDLWTRTFAHAGISCTYDAWEVPTQAGLPAVERALRNRRASAVNVTMPYKRWAVQVADEADADASISGVGNLLIMKDGRLVAMNTDIAAVRSGIGGRHFGRVLLLGAGGAAHAAAFALQGRIDSVDISAVDGAASEKLVDELDGRCGTAVVRSWADRAVELDTYNLIINATPIGRDGSEDELPWGSTKLADGAVIYDFVYANRTNAVETYARTHRHELIDGWIHLYLQAHAMIEPLGLPAAVTAALKESIGELRPSVSGAGSAVRSAGIANDTGTHSR